MPVASDVDEELGHDASGEGPAFPGPWVPKFPRCCIEILGVAGEAKGLVFRVGSRVDALAPLCAAFYEFLHRPKIFKDDVRKDDVEALRNSIVRVVFVRVDLLVFRVAIVGASCCNCCYSCA